NESGSTFSATSRCNFVSRARYTSPISPTPRSDRTSYAPTRVPGESDIGPFKESDYITFNPSGHTLNKPLKPELTLRRELGKWDLTAIGSNQTIGSAIFFLPSQVVAQVGNWSPIAFLATGFASLMV